MTRRLPLTVIGGFLGAGKTSVLNHWLAHAGGRRLAILVNDFGALNVDAALIAAAGGDAIALSNGCVCCQIGDDLTGALMRILAAPQPFDAVVVEASGVSDPWRIAQIGLADPGLSLAGVVVVDSAALLQHAADPLLADTLLRQIGAADLLLLNKSDLVCAAETASLQTWLDTHAGAAPRLAVTHGALPVALLDDLQPSAAAGPACAHDHHPHHHHDHHHVYPDHGGLFETWSARPSGHFRVPALREALKHLPGGVLRLKGWLPTVEQGWSECQFAGRHGQVRRTGTPPEGAALVAIGLSDQLPHAALTAWLDSAR